MARQPNTQDVSVDEIIASIRRIVADDDQGNTSSAADSVAAAAPSVGDAAGFRPRSTTAMEDILNFPPVNPGILGARAELQQPHVAASEDADRKPPEQTIGEPQAPPPAMVGDSHAEATAAAAAQSQDVDESGYRTSLAVANCGGSGRSRVRGFVTNRLRIVERAARCDGA